MEGGRLQGGIDGLTDVKGIACSLDQRSAKRSTELSKTDKQTISIDRLKK